MPALTKVHTGGLSPPSCVRGRRDQSTSLKYAIICDQLTKFGRHGSLVKCTAGRPAWQLPAFASQVRPWRTASIVTLWMLFPRLCPLRRFGGGCGHCLPLHFVHQCDHRAFDDSCKRYPLLLGRLVDRGQALLVESRN